MPPRSTRDLSATRRGFLQGGAVGVTVAAFARPALTRAEFGRTEDVPPLDRYQRVFLSDAEWVFILAAVARLIPSEGEGPGAIEARVPVFIDRQLSGDFGGAATLYMQGPHVPDADPHLGYQSPLSPAQIYRGAIPIFNDWCIRQKGAAFADLAAAEQDEAITALMAGKVPLPPEMRDFGDLLLQNTKEGYFADPMYGGNHGMQAWVHIGFPGARGSFLEWIDQRDVPYPLGPVSISGDRA